MPAMSWVSCAAVKDAVQIERVLERIGHHKGCTRGNSRTTTTGRGFKCFACGAKGNVLGSSCGTRRRRDTGRCPQVGEVFRPSLQHLHAVHSKERCVGWESETTKAARELCQIQASVTQSAKGTEQPPSSSGPRSGIARVRAARCLLMPRRNTWAFLCGFRSLARKRRRLRTSR